MKIKIIKNWNGSVQAEAVGSDWCDCIELAWVGSNGIECDPMFYRIGSIKRGRVKSLRKLRVFIKRKFLQSMDA